MWCRWIAVASAGRAFHRRGDRAAEEAQHAAHALEVGERRGLAGERLEHVGVERIAGAEALDRVSAGSAAGGQCLALAVPERAVGLDHLGRAGIVDPLEQPTAQHLRRSRRPRSD